MTCYGMLSSINAQKAVQSTPKPKCHRRAAGPLQRTTRNSCSMYKLSSSTLMYFANWRLMQVHGEQFLLANLLLHQERVLQSLVISAAPCGHCRQFYSELACAVSKQRAWRDKQQLSTIIITAMIMHVVTAGRCIASWPAREHTACVA